MGGDTVLDGDITIYADVLFFINFFLDFLCLYITGKLLCLPMKTLRVTLAAALGGGYACVSLFLDGAPAYICIPSHAAAAFLVCIAAFGFRKAAVNTGVFALSCGLSGGLMCGAYALMGKSFYAGGGFYVDADPLFVLIFAAVASAASLLYLLLCRRRRFSGTVSLSFVFDGRSYKAELLCDSGCFLRDGMSGDPVVIVAKDVLHGQPSVSGADEKTLAALGKTARLVPVRTVSGCNMLAAFRPDSITVMSGGRRRRIPAVIALDCGGTSYGGLDGIFPAELL